MSTKASDQELASSILEFVESGAYPESDNVVSTELSSAALPVILDVVGKAESDLKSEIRSLSSQSAPDIDGWIAQAKRLQADIERSKATAREIVQEAEAGKSLHAHAGDAANKVELLKKELDFNETLAGALEMLQVVAGLLDSVQDAVIDGDLDTALGKLENSKGVLKGLEVFSNTRFAILLERRVGVMRELLVEKVLTCWSSLVMVDTVEQKITVVQGRDGSPMSLTSTVDAMARLDILPASSARLHRDLQNLIIGPRLTPATDGTNAQLTVTEESIQASGRAKDADALSMIKDVYSMINFLSKSFPEIVSVELLDMILPSLILQLISGWLDPSLPLELDRLGNFKEVATQVSDLSRFVSGTHVTMPSEADLSAWIRRIPQTWLARKKEAVLTTMRVDCYKAAINKKTVERVETQIVSSDDVIVAGKESQQQDDWNVGWDDDGEEQANGPKEPATAAEEDDEVDDSAWGLDEPEQPYPEDAAGASKDDEDDVEAEAWGWGEEHDETVEQPPMVETETKPTAKSNLPTRQQPPTQREITLRETYTVTSIPDSILELISQILKDASTLSIPDFPVPSISAARTGLSSIPTLLLAMYRATASTFYANEPAGNMLIYNDTQHLLSSLQVLLSTIPESHPLSQRLRLDADIQSLGAFARRAYGREMDSQRTILTDLLSSASGFVNSTAPLNSRQYSATVQDAVERVRDVDRTWTSVLSTSARMQSLGSLLGTLVRKMVSDILELADEPAGISEDQSRILKGFCEKIGELADLFQEPGEEAKSLVHVYTPDWLRFVYLGEILEANLADIRYLWTEGELSLEFEAGEVVELVTALFADSPLRRDAVKEIRSIH